ncbi:MAG: hypothetical protein IJM72_07220, partial [Deltaproteobacteria bacterium]|nr:hypothetical protein [Deltaproteobacteria bacterium]
MIVLSETLFFIFASPGFSGRKVKIQDVCRLSRRENQKFSVYRRRQTTLEKRSEGRFKAKTIRYHNTSFPPKTLNW